MKKVYTSLTEAYMDYQFYEHYEEVDGDMDYKIVEYMFMNDVDAEEAVKAVAG